MLLIACPAACMPGGPGYMPSWFSLQHAQLTMSIPATPPPRLPLQTAVASVGDARDDWKVVRALSEVGAACQAALQLQLPHVQGRLGCRCSWCGSVLACGHRPNFPVQPALHPAQVLGTPLPYNSLDDVRRRLADVAPHFGRRDAVEAPLWLNGEYFKVRMRAGGEVASAEERLSLLRCGT